MQKLIWNYKLSYVAARRALRKVDDYYFERALKQPLKKVQLPSNDAEDERRKRNKNWSVRF